MIRYLLVLAFATATALPPLANATGVQTRIVDEAGQPIASANVLINGEVVTIDTAGRFEVSGDDRLLTVSVRADGYYDFVHTIGRNKGMVADIVLVKRKPHRRLLLFAGDTMLARRYFEPREGEPVLVRRGHIAEDGEALFRHVAPYVRLADFASLNLETQLADEDPADRLPKSVTFYSPTAMAGLVRDAGFDYVALGNNHMYDYRNEGLQSTLDAVVAAGLAWSGAGTTEGEARRPFLGQIDGSPIAYLSYVGWAGGFTPNQVAGPDKGGAALGDAEAFAADLAPISQRPAVVQYHSGLEYVEAPPMRERTSLRSAIDSGADLAIGHHSHVIQGFEIHDGKLINFSLGNFLFDQYHYTTQLGMLLYIWMDGEDFHRAEIVPLHINGYVPTPATGNMRFAVLNRLARLSAPYGVCLQSSGVHAVILPDTDQTACAPQTFDGSSRSQGIEPIALAGLGLSPLRPVIAPAADRYRVGVDILRRGDFSSVGLFGSVDRAWIEDSNVSVDIGDESRLRVEIAPGEGPARAGMRVFERVFRASTPATVSGRVHIEGDLEVRLLLQRRRTSDGLDEALAFGPVSEIGRIERPGTGWQAFSFDYDQPRIATRSVRLLLEVRSIDGKGGRALFDDLAWVEWHTPWLSADDAPPAFGSHIVFGAED